jgi:hypothetical protein
MKDRTGGFAGVAFVALFMTSVFFGGSDLGGPDQSSEVIAQDLFDNRYGGLRPNIALVGLASFAGIWFVADVHRRLLSISRSAASWAALGGGLMTVVFILATSLFLEAAITAESLVEDPQVAKTLWLLEHASWALLGPPLAAFAFGVSIVSLGHGTPPRWIGLSGLVLVAALALNLLLGLGGLAVVGLLWVLGLAAANTIRPFAPTEELT